MHHFSHNYIDSCSFLRKETVQKLIHEQFLVNDDVVFSAGSSASRRQLHQPRFASTMQTENKKQHINWPHVHKRAAAYITVGSLPSFPHRLQCVLERDR